MKILIAPLSMLSILSSTMTVEAWEIDGFRSGMPATSIEEGALVATLRKTPLGDRKNAYVLQGGGKWFSVCNALVYAYSFEMTGGYDEFVMAVEREQQRRDRASMFVYSPKMEILAQWEDGHDVLTIGIGRDLTDGRLTVSKGFRDQAVERACR